MMTEDKCLQTVLVVDDEALVLKYTTSVISGLGYKKVLKARSAQEARAILLAERVSLIISDVSLPEGDGRQIGRETLEQNAGSTGVLITRFSQVDLLLPPDLAGVVQSRQQPCTAAHLSHLRA